MIELLAPAGDLEKLKIAYLYGADACYIGGEEFSLRARASNFALKEIKEGALFAHQLKKKLYVTLNIVPHNENLKELIPYLKALEEAAVDGVIVASPYILKMVKAHTNLEAHVSTQQSITNSHAIKFYEQLGAKRIVLARELSLKEIKEIKKATKTALEVFIHGGACSSYSGRCTLSNTLTLRDANRGGCAHSCRWLYDVYSQDKKISQEQPFSMGAKDLQTITLVPELIKMEIDSLKIEGRMKSIHYIATVVNAYRMLIDEFYQKGKISDFSYYEEELLKAENRLTSSGFLKGFVDSQDQLYNRHLEIPKQTFVGIVLKTEKELVKLEQRNYFEVGDQLAIFGPNKKPRDFTLKVMYDENFQILQVARHPQQIVYIEVPFQVESYDLVRKQ
ncbi:MAG: U32 family peptidase [Acholeplasmatales bacterium]|jgi:putative protease|nr:U32 family peptidase [Acholeplasmataceae bacterium]MDY0115322.1 U32 family peptidase [Acholeplasmatales bacterium]MCK9233946.1 U32 family peptidase [Acholeplasmataceae bacterium]MCK9288909.1 U32 family peptidase [Acholeplasmataceae bacterium]MCK9427503.1 U32 family peptidase [Acholeplasmataceae bacterium]